MRLLKLESEYKGWVGEECWQHGRKFIKRLEHKSNRRFAKKQIKHEVDLQTN